ncbi:MAG: ABC transporter permease [Bacteroidales bacterium]|nr:ABC transporter permease [Bacteroidales bacterium]
MKFRNIKTIISREYLTRVRKKSFLITTFIVPILLAAVCVLPAFIMGMIEDKGKQIAVVDQSGIVMPFMENSSVATYHDLSSDAPDSLKSHLSELGYDVLLVVSPVDEVERTVHAVSYSVKPISMDVKDAVQSRLDEAVEEYRIGLYEIEDLKTIMDDVESDVEISSYVIDGEGNEAISSSEVYMVVSMALAMIIYMFIALFSGMIMQGVIEEKSSRVVEVLVSSVKATELMFGKIIGVACVALTQFFLWIALTVVLVAGISSFSVFGNMMSDPESMEQMMGMVNMGGMEESIDMSSGGSSMILSTLANMNFGQIIIAFIIYFILGYLLYASLFAAIGSAVENEADTNQLQMPVTIPLLLAFFIAFYAFKSPDSAVVFWGSMIPFTSPIVMLARIPFGVPVWELVLSIAILALTFVVCAWASAKIYRIGILMFGKKTTFADLWKWLKQK